ncbi:hypothetical protein BH09ACT6_BH09ACT6_04940 [soil metagenome]
MPEAARLPVEDRLDICDLYARQSHAIDGGDARQWALTFTIDGVFESPTFHLTAVGHQELEKFARESNDAALARGEQLRHWMNAIVILPRTSEEADVHAYLMIIATSSAGSRIDRSLRVEDVVSRADGEWLLAHRQVFRDA